MFEWNADKVRFMEDAAAWGDFHARLAAALAPYLGGRICDAGCGTGHLSLALSPYVKQVTAVDVSGQLPQTGHYQYRHPLRRHRPTAAGGAL